MYYALEYTRRAIAVYGLRPETTVHAFRSRAQRDQWVRAGSMYSSQAGYRLVVSAHDPRVRKARRGGR